jgi:hypothetical protein
MGYNCCFFLNFVPLHIESPYNLGGTGPILRVKNPLQRVNGHAVNRYYSKYIVIVQLNLSPSREAISLIRPLFHCRRGGVIRE